MKDDAKLLYDGSEPCRCVCVYLWDVSIASEAASIANILQADLWLEGRPKAQAPAYLLALLLHFASFKVCHPEIESTCGESWSKRL